MNRILHMDPPLNSTSGSTSRYLSTMRNTCKYNIILLYSINSRHVFNTDTKSCRSAIGSTNRLFESLEFHRTRAGREF